jgi:hypothetical protein
MKTLVATRKTRTIMQSPVACKLRLAKIMSDVRFWPIADMPSCTAHVRFLG